MSSVHQTGVGKKVRAAATGRTSHNPARLMTASGERWHNKQEKAMSSQTAAPNTEAAILARLIQIGQEELSRGAAEYLLSIRFDEQDTARMNEL